MTSKLIRFFLGSTLVLLPMIGVGTVVLMTGTDTGAGFQPSYITMALAIALSLFGQVGLIVRPAALFRFIFSNVPRPYLMIIFMTLLVVLLSAIGIKYAPVAGDSSLAWGRFIRQLIQLVVMGCFTVFLAAFLGQQGAGALNRWQFFSRLLVFGALLQVVYGVVQGINFFHPWVFYAGLEKVFTSNPAILSGSETLYLGNAFQNVPRLRGTACEPLYLGNYLLLVWPFVFLSGWTKFWKAAVTVLLLGMLLFTWSRGAWLGFLVQGSLILFFYLRTSPSLLGRRMHISRRVLAIVAILVLALGLFILFGGTWHGLAFPFERLRQSFSTQDWSNLTRLYSMEAAWRAFLLSPVVGVGWGQFAWHFPILVDPMGLQSQFTWPVVNNYPLQILCETGGLGLVVFLSSGLFILRRGFAVCRHRKIISAPVVALVATCGVWFQLLTFSQYNLPHIWVALGTLAATSFWGVQENADKEHAHE